MSTQQENMIDGQLRPNHIRNHAVLGRFAQVERAPFAAPEAQPFACLDQPTPMVPGRSMLPPMAIARLIQELDIQTEDHVLIIAGGTGYSAAILAGLAHKVTMVEDNPILFALAEKNLKPFKNITFIKAAPTAEVLKDHADAILIDTPFATLPENWSKQLKNGGKMAGVQQDESGILRTTLFTKHGKTWLSEILADTKGEVHPALQAPTTFVF